MILINKLNSIAEVNRDILNGTPVFKGTRVSVLLILEYLAKGWSIEDLKTSYPSVKPTYISRLIELYAESLRKWNGKKNQITKAK